MAKLNIIGPGYEGRSKNLNASRCINFYPELETQDSKGVVALIGTPGCTYWQSVANKVRGMHVFNDLIYFVADNRLYSVNINREVSEALGVPINTRTGRVIFSDNGLSPAGGNQLVFSDGVKIYCYDIVTELITAFEIASSVNCFIGGYFVADYGSGGRFRWSALNDGNSWNALDFATAESSPDDLVTLFNNHGELWLFGTYSTEIWYQSGNSESPFARVSGGVIDYGCAAKYSVAQCDNTVYWLGTIRNNNQAEFIGVCKATGYGVEVVSPMPITYAMSQYNVLEDAFAFAYAMDGHEFYVLTFPGQNATWVYDTKTRLWHEWSSYSDDPYKYNRHLSNAYCYFKNRHFIADHRTNVFLELSSKIYTENNDPIASVRITNNLYDAENLENIFISELKLDCEVGFGASSEQFYGYMVDARFPQSSTNLVMTINDIEVFNALVTSDDLTPSVLTWLTMIACNFGLANMPQNEIWGFFYDRVTLNPNGTLTVQMLGGTTATINPHYANIKAMISNPDDLYSDVYVYSTDPAYKFTMSFENPYADTLQIISTSETFDPTVVMSYSNDGGFTFGNEQHASLGKVGEYKNRVVWRRLGHSKNRVFRFAISDPVKKVINAQYIRAV